jgi:hypothetical protein
MSQFRPDFNEVEEGQTAIDALTEALLRFGTCELQMREAARLEALELDEQHRQLLVESAQSHNEKGLTALAAVRPFADVLRRQPDDEKTLSGWRESSGEIRAEWRHEVSQLDVGGDDSQHLYKIMDECGSVLDKAGLKGLGGYLSGRIAELEVARRSPSRGTEAASFPFWKIIGAAIILGVTIWEVWNLLSIRAPWWQFWLIAQINCVAMLCMALGC